MVNRPAIIVVGYNRPNSIERLLLSLNEAIYESKVKLLISLDSGGGGKVLNVVNSFKWKYGEKEVIIRDERLGLRRHIIECGNLAEIYGSIILLEDDLYVSPYFYKYATDALDYYSDEERISGISLYNHKLNQFALMPFEPLYDNSDVYFLKLAASWGQIWTKKQWGGFIDWYNQCDGLQDVKGLPARVLNWPESSWLKYFNAYMSHVDKYFVYPRVSLTTNFCDAGTHFDENHNDIYQVPLLQHYREFTFQSFDDANAIYDSWFEFDSYIVSNIIFRENEKKIDFDLYGLKQRRDLNAEYVITSKEVSNSIKTFGGGLKPNELNIIRGVPGDVYSLARVEDVDLSGKSLASSYREYSHNFPIPGIRLNLKCLSIRLAEKIRGCFS